MMTGLRSLLSGKFYSIMRLARHMIVVALIFSSFHLIGASTQVGDRVLDVCTDADKFRCEDGELISLVEIACGRRGSCPRDTNQTLFDLCQGQQTCTTLGIEAMIGSHCSIKDESVRVKFHCVPGSTSLCVTNICDDLSTGLTCPERTLVHLRRISCATVTDACPRSVYTTLFLCDGANRCAASGLKTLLSQSCQHELKEKRNVIIHYSCVPEQQVENRCSSTKYRVLDKDFGILRYPYLDSGNRLASSECKWLINPIPGSKVKVTVHLVNTKIKPTGCDPGVLSVTFEDCITGSTTTRSFCIVDDSSVELVSCGQVKIDSIVLPGLESSDKFIVSYTRYHSVAANTELSGLASCLAPPIILTSETPPRTTSLQPFSKAEVGPSSKAIPATTTHGYGFRSGVVEYRNSLSPEGVKAADMSRQPKSSSKQLKIIILYIFFGVVIFVLTVTLIAVLISYYRISKLRDQRGDSSEKTALCQPHEDTPLDTFQNHFAESCGTTETTYAFRTDNGSDQVLATVHHDGASDQEDADNRLSSGSRLSTFLSGKRDTDFRDLINTFQTGNFALYSSLGGSSSSGQIDPREPGYYEMADAGHYDLPSNHELSDIYESIDHDKSRNTDNSPVNYFSSDTRALRNHDHEHVMGDNYGQQSSVSPNYSPSNNLHYRINDDEYAVVCKQKKQPQTMVSEEDQEDCLNNGVSVDFCPTSGPYDRRRQFAADTSARWSKGDNDRWGDDL